MSQVHASVVDSVERRIGITLKEKWRIDAVVGIGGMAAVYAATHRNGNRVAVKILHPQLSIDANLRARFLREGYVANTVQHSGVVRVLDDDTAEDGAAFLVMELLEGEAVASRADRFGGKLPVDEVVLIADQLLDTLAAAHERGVVHRDIKPENIFLTLDGVVKILDFGIARVREATSTSQTSTRTGTLMGTPCFMPPEQALGRMSQVDGQSDLWAAAASLFTLLSGELVHIGETPNEQLIAAATQPARSVLAVAPGLSPAVAAVIDKALLADKAQRWLSARDMHVALREAVGMPPPGAAVPSPSVSMLASSGQYLAHISGSSTSLLRARPSGLNEEGPASTSARSGPVPRLTLDDLARQRLAAASTEVSFGPAGAKLGSLTGEPIILSSATRPPKRKLALVGVLITVAILGATVFGAVLGRASKNAQLNAAAASVIAPVTDARRESPRSSGEPVAAPPASAPVVASAASNAPSAVAMKPPVPAPKASAKAPATKAPAPAPKAKPKNWADRKK